MTLPMSEPDDPSDDADDEMTFAEQALGLNTRLYASDPADYFRRRVATVRSVGDAAADSDDAASVHRYVTTESMLLLHHVAESVLRWYLAHAAQTDCPWLDMVAEKHFDKFKESVDERIRKASASDLEGTVAAIMFASKWPAAEPAGIERAVPNTAAFMRVFADRFLSHSPAYNAAKHGMAVIGGEMFLNFIGSDGGAASIAQGATVEFIAVTKFVHNERDWSSHTEWQDVRENLALVDVGASVLDSMWAVARARFLGDHGGGQLFWPVDLRPLDLRTPNASANASWRTHLFTETKDPAPPV